MRTLIRYTLLLFIMGLLLSCQSKTQTRDTVVLTPPPITSIPEALVTTECKSPRATMCTRDYRPVCAIKDTGVRCVATPCPSTEKVTKSNACTACSDDKVFSYTDGACEGSN